MSSLSWLGAIALGVDGAVMVISVIFAVIGVPYSYESVSMTCPTGSPCIQTISYGTTFVPISAAIIPLLLGVVVIAGSFKRPAISWAGTVGLLFFSIITGFSVGLLYMPFVLALTGLLAIIQVRGGFSQTNPPKS